MTRSTSRLQQELQQSRPFRSIYQEAALSLLKTADLLRRSLSTRLEPHGITPQQYNVLRVLRGAGPEGIPTLAIGERLIEETPGLTRLLDRLETKGLALRRRCPQDRRQVLCFLTPEGGRLLDILQPSVDSLEQLFAEAISTPEAERLVQLLERIRERQHNQ
ncbi:MAG: MarR family transcriptional regulator [Acidobacteria bacterium]|nr:MarR family transcriptional regulator [Acidobacteriota bacterium]